MKREKSELTPFVDQLRLRSRSTGAPIWRKLGDRLARGKRKRVVLNVGQLARLSDKGDVVAVPGKVLGTGDIKHQVTVAAYSFSPQAAQKITRSGGKCLSLLQLADEHPLGTKVKVLVR